MSKKGKRCSAINSIKKPCGIEATETDKDGKLWCRLHAARNAGQGEQERRVKLFPELLEALRNCLGALEEARDLLKKGSPGRATATASIKATRKTVTKMGRESR